MSGLFVTISWLTGQLINGVLVKFYVFSCV